MTDRPAPESSTRSEQSGWQDMSDPDPEESPSTEPSGAEPAPTRAAPTEDPLARTRASQTWIGIIVFALILVLLLVFVLENTKKVPVTYFGATWSIPLAVAMLLSAVAGVLLTAIAGTLRILQLRRRVRTGQRAP